MPATKRPQAHDTTSRFPRNAAATQTRILASALELFAAHGYDGVSLDDVAVAASVRKATLFYYFESKDHLYAAVARAVGQVFDIFAERLAHEPPTAESLISLATELHEMLASVPRGVVLLVREAIDHKAKGVNLAFEPLVALGERFLRSGQQSGAFDSDLDPRAAIDAIVGSLTLFFLGPDHFLSRGRLTPEAIAAHRERFVGFVTHTTLSRGPARAPATKKKTRRRS